jgi:hypothetical protein
MSAAEQWRVVAELKQRRELISGPGAVKRL